MRDIAWPYRHMPGRWLVVGVAVVAARARARHERAGRAGRGRARRLGRSPRCAGWGLVVLWCGALVASGRSSSTRHGPRRRSRTAFAWPADSLLGAPAPLRRAGGSRWRRGDRRSASPSTAAILTVSVAFVALVACRSVYPARRPARTLPFAGMRAVTLPIQVGPSTITMNRDDRFVVCQPDGRIERLAEEGFFARDTRFVSGYEVFLNGQRPALLNASPVAVLLVALRIHQPGAARPRRRRAPSQPGPAHRPDGLGRRPRGLRPRQLRPAAGPPDDRDRDRVRLRRHLRRQGRPARPPRRDQRALVPLERASSGRPTSIASSSASWSSRRTARTARRSSPTAGSCSSPRSRPRASGTPACAGCR